jgi:GDPmannose 4,6-dehydratase
VTERPRRALVTGITGQDGSFLAEELLHRGYEVIGLTRRNPSQSLGATEPLRARLTLLQGDVRDPETRDAITQLAPAEIYHLAAPTFVPDSWADPAATMDAIHGSAAALLHTLTGDLAATRLFLAGSAEMFGDAPVSPQREDTPARPRTPYATAKLAACQLAAQLRDTTAGSRSPGSSTTTSQSAGHRASSPARSHARQPRSRWGTGSDWRSVTCPPSVTGRSPAT